MRDPEPRPSDPYTEMGKNMSRRREIRGMDESASLLNFYRNEGKVLKFYGIWKNEPQRPPAVRKILLKVRNIRDLTNSAVKHRKVGHSPSICSNPFKGFLRLGPTIRYPPSYSRRKGFLASLNWTRCAIPTTRNLANLLRAVKLYNQFSIPLHNPFETAKKLRRENRVQNTTGHGNGSRRSDLASLMFTTTSRETTDALTSPRETSSLPVPSMGSNAHRGRNLWVI
ncbi:hypothetical protein AVEN_228901-1 [Araneus ventricosus]|uniref:Uncharacterized protein n=1 Tax=Araneus ventricosus TaxID=182803 RepID=A0A4Y1ZRS4_ARAVE|nr:hypothetical protein AVEN_228901-1 [Araneus ventricosus]